MMDQAVDFCNSGNISKNDDNGTYDCQQQQYDMYRIALYYCYIPIPQQSSVDLDRIVTFHSSYNNMNITNITLGGRIRVSYEGLNGVLSGKLDDLYYYEQQLRTLLQSIVGNQLSTISWELDVKYCHLRTDLSISDQLFPSLNVQVTDTVVGLIEKDILSIQPQHDEVEDNFDSKDDVATEANTTKDSLIVVPSTSSRRRRNRHIQQQNQIQLLARSIYQTSIFEKVCHEQLVIGAPHLSPMEWNMKLEQLVLNDNNNSNNTNSNVVLLDCRNCYESAIGYFQVPGATTILTNTRKYSELPIVLLNQLYTSTGSGDDKAIVSECKHQQNEQQMNITKLRSASHIFMYCTGGVRCERASAFLQSAFLTSKVGNNSDDNDHDNLATTSKESPEIYQLHGGIQRYLEQFSNQEQQQTAHYYKGKNFVFDLRRTDPTIDSPSHNDTKNITVVGKCLVCNQPHDDYDNGYAPILQKETRCCKCRILILVCNTCRSHVLCWGDDHPDIKTINTNNIDGNLQQQHLKRKLFCGGLEPKECLNIPPIKIIEG